MAKVWSASVLALCMGVACVPVASAAVERDDWQQQYLEALAREDYAVAEEAVTRAYKTLSAKPDWRVAASRSVVTRLAGLRRLQGRYREAEQLLLPVFAALKATPAIEGLAQAPLLLELGRIHADTLQYAKAEAAYAGALSLLRGREMQSPDLHGDLLLSMAALLADQQRNWEALQWATRLKELRTQRYGPADVRVARALTWIGELNGEPRRFPAQADAFGRALPVFESNYKAGLPTPFEAHQDLIYWLDVAYAHRDAKSLPHTCEVRKALIPAIEKERGNTSPTLIEALVNHASYCEDELSFAQADKLFKRALAISDKAFGRDHPRTVYVLDHTATFYASREFDSERLDAKAQALRREIRAINTRLYGADGMVVAMARLDDVFEHGANCRYGNGSCQAHIKGLLQPLQAEWGPTHPHLGIYLRSVVTRIGRIRSRDDEAERKGLTEFILELLQWGRQVLVSAYGTRHPEIAHLDKQHAEFLTNSLQQPLRAIEPMRLALETYRAFYGQGDEPTADVRRELVRLLMIAKRYDAALAYCEQDLPFVLKQEQALPHLPMDLLSDLAFLRAQAGRIEDAEAAYQLGVEVARRNGVRSHWVRALEALHSFYVTQKLTDKAVRIDALLQCAKRQSGISIPACP